MPMIVLDFSVGIISRMFYNRNVKRFSFPHTFRDMCYLMISVGHNTEYGASW